MCWLLVLLFLCFFFCKQKTAYEMRISDWSSDVCSSDLVALRSDRRARGIPRAWLEEVVELVFDSHPDGVVGRCVRREAAWRGADDRAVAGRSVGRLRPAAPLDLHAVATSGARNRVAIGRASCRERVCQYV